MTGTAARGSTPGVINAVGAESQYANVLSQIGGRYVHVSSVLDNPNTDPHTFEASTSVAEEVARADLIVQNGIGYDDFMDKIESASPNPTARSSWPSTSSASLTAHRTRTSGTTRRPCRPWPR